MLFFNINCVTDFICSFFFCKNPIRWVLKIKRIILLFFAITGLTSCAKEDTNDSGMQAEQTILIYMP